MAFHRLSILGVGLLGGSIGLALKSTSNPVYIKGYGHKSQTLQTARALEAIDEPCTELAQAVAGAELVLLCTPVGSFSEILQTISPLLTAGTIVSDVGSTKRSVVRLAEQILPPGVHFVGSHPMAGSEKRGIEAARAELYRGALCITTPTPRTDSAALDRVESFWKELGMRVTRLSPEEHDRLLGDISHLPHALAAALVAMQPDQALPLAGRGYFDTTRIAAGDGGLWRDILLDNADNLRDSLRRMRLQLDRLDAMLEPDQSQQLRQWLDSAAAKRLGRFEGPDKGNGE